MSDPTKPHLEGAEGFGDLIAEADAARGPGKRARRSSLASVSLGELVARGRTALFGTSQRRKRTMIIGGPLVLALGVGAFFILKPMSKPDYQRDGLRRVMTYTLLTDQFNRLPIEERMRLVGQLVSRFKGMSSSDSVLLAAFAAGIQGQARQQMEENASKMMIDLWDKYASQYAGVGKEDRNAFLDRTIIDLQKMMEGLGGQTREMSDEQRLAEAKEQAKRDEKRMAGSGALPSRAMGRMMEVMGGNIGSHASPAQRARGLAMMGDMVNHLRGHDGP
jgi:hypothetical protein